jgi:hypothetical protein
MSELVVSGSAWAGLMEMAEFEFELGTSYNDDVAFYRGLSRRIFITPLSGLGPDWFGSHREARMMQLLGMIPVEEMQDLKLQAARDLGAEIFTEAEPGEKVWWVRDRVEQGFYEAVNAFLESHPKMIRERLDAIFDSKVAEEVEADPRIQALHERQTALAQEEMALAQELIAEREGGRPAFHFVANDEAWEPEL